MIVATKSEDLREDKNYNSNKQRPWLDWNGYQIWLKQLILTNAINPLFHSLALFSKFKCNCQHVNP